MDWASDEQMMIDDNEAEAEAEASHSSNQADSKRGSREIKVVIETVVQSCSVAEEVQPYEINPTFTPDSTPECETSVLTDQNGQ